MLRKLGSAALTAFSFGPPFAEPRLARISVQFSNYEAGEDKRFPRSTFTNGLLGAEHSTANTSGDDEKGTDEGLSERQRREDRGPIVRQQWCSPLIWVDEWIGRLSLRRGGVKAVDTGPRTRVYTTRSRGHRATHVCIHDTRSRTHGLVVRGESPVQRVQANGTKSRSYKRGSLASTFRTPAREHVHACWRARARTPASARRGKGFYRPGTCPWAALRWYTIYTDLCRRGVSTLRPVAALVISMLVQARVFNSW